MAAERRPCNALFVCTGNSARSVVAEVILRAEGGHRFRAHSARRNAFAKASRTLTNRIRAFVGLPLDELDRLSLRRRLDDLGKSPANATAV